MKVKKKQPPKKCRFKDCNNDAGGHGYKSWPEICAQCAQEMKEKNNCALMRNIWRPNNEKK